MKIAIVSDDEKTISQHFGRAEKYIVVSCEQENIIERKSLPKLGFCHTSKRHHGRHEHQSDPRGSGFGRQSKASHEQMFENIKDCDMLVSRGMGRGAYLDLQQLGIRPIITDIVDIDAAIQAVMDDSIIDHVEKLH
ncbi:MAG: NifB/NifX family molybdenum-iron cluster-binding protein [Xanthomonadales bacterium]|nr:NifB/NifX family molybdenum-iron cluster-binding protein [Xanthomonadales bacterium]